MGLLLLAISFYYYYYLLYQLDTAGRGSQKAHAAYIQGAHRGYIAIPIAKET